MNLLSLNLLSAIEWKPFLTPAPVWDYWYLLLIPLVIGVSIVYKSIKCAKVSQIPREAAAIAIYILLAMVALAVGVMLIFRMSE